MLPLQATKLPDWNSVDAKNLRAFLESDCGQRALAHVMEQCPSLLTGGGTNEILIASGAVKGFTEAVSTLFSLTVEKPAAAIQSVAYPELDDESQWTGATNNPPNL